MSQRNKVFIGWFVETEYFRILLRMRFQRGLGLKIVVIQKDTESNQINKKKVTVQWDLISPKPRW